MARDYYSSYRRYLTKPWKHQLDKLGPGHLINFKYRQKRSDTRPRLLMILDNSSTKLHCLKLNDIPRYAFERFFKRIMTLDTALIIKRRSELKFPVKESVQFPQEAYVRFLRRSPVIKKYQAYRTYFTNKITAVKLIGYDTKHLYSDKKLEDEQLKRILIDKRDSLKEIKQEDNELLKELLNIDEFHDLEDREFRELVNFRFGSKRNFNAAVQDVLNEEE
jgi:hypothetical protein